MWDVKAGDEVVCIKEFLRGPYSGPSPFPIIGNVYTVQRVAVGRGYSAMTGFAVDVNDVGLVLVGHCQHTAYIARCFRKVLKRDIGVLRDLLAPTPKIKVLENV